jgi:hypothetical protein
MAAKIRFGVYELDSDAMELRKHGEVLSRATDYIWSGQLVSIRFVATVPARLRKIWLPWFR